MIDAKFNSYITEDKMTFLSRQRELPRAISSLTTFRVHYPASKFMNILSLFAFEDGEVFICHANNGLGISSTTICPEWPPELVCCFHALVYPFVSVSRVRYVCITGAVLVEFHKSKLMSINVTGVTDLRVFEERGIRYVISEATTSASQHNRF